MRGRANEAPLRHATRDTDRRHAAACCDCGTPRRAAPTRFKDARHSTTPRLIRVRAFSHSSLHSTLYTLRRTFAFDIVHTLYSPNSRSAVVLTPPPLPSPQPPLSTSLYLLLAAPLRRRFAASCLVVAVFLFIRLFARRPPPPPFLHRSHAAASA